MAFLPLLLGITFAAVYILSRKYGKKQNKSKSLVSVFPELKTPFFSIYGAFRTIPSNSSLKKLSLPPSSYTVQITSGIGYLFLEAKVIVSRAIFGTYIFLTKAESLEEFMNSSANILSTKPDRGILLPLFGDGLFLSSGQRWKLSRKNISRLFNVDILKEFVPVFDQESKILVDILKRKAHEPWLDVLQYFSPCTMDIICGTFLGMCVRAQTDSEFEFLHVMGRVTKTVTERSMNPLFRLKLLFDMSPTGWQFKKDLGYMRQFANQAISKRKEERKLIKKENVEDKRLKNMLDLLLEYEENDEYFVNEMTRDELLSFIFASQDTTALALSWATYFIGLYPEVQSKIHKELDDIFMGDPHREITCEHLKEMCYLECVLKESQRICPVVAINGREMLEDCTVFGCEIKKGTTVFMDIYSLHRNPEVFPDPEVFDPNRFLPENSAGRSSYAYLPFSGGLRACLGKLYAMMELKTVMAHVLYNFSVESLEPRDKVRIKSEISFRPVDPLKVKFTPRLINDETKM